MPAVTNKKLKPFRIPRQIWEAIINLNELFGFNPSFSKFATSSLTTSATLNLKTAISVLGYEPSKNFDNSYLEIVEWINQIGGWETYLSSIPVK